jgi:NAD(P)H-dependent FMN reductase
MITVVSGTNRPNSNSLKLARLASDAVRAAGQAVELLDLAELPIELFSGSAYAEKPAGFAPFQRTIVETHGVLSVIPEYNGACPGVMKYFIDMLRFPESLYEKPAGFIGLSSGPWGAVRAVEQLEMVFQYRHAHLFGRRCFIPNIGQVLDGDGAIIDPAVAKRFDEMVGSFVEFCERLRV